MSSLELSSEIIASFIAVKKLSLHKLGYVTSIDFDDNGLWCLSAGDDESIQLYDTKTGKHSKTIYSKKYGVGLVRFTHDSMKCVYTSTKEDDTIRLLSLYDNQYIRYFKGHESRVISLEVSPVTDIMISAGMDNTVRIWDIKSGSCQGLLNVEGPALAAFDATGLVFALACQLSRKIILHSTQHYERQPFLEIDASVVSSTAIWVKVEFSNNGKLLMLVTDSDEHYIFNAISGHFLATLKGHSPLPPRSTSMLMSHCAFSVDGSHVISGSGDKKLVIWETEDIGRDDQPSIPKVLFPVGTIDSDEYAYILSYSPKTMLLVTANQSSLIFWLPNESTRPQKRPDTQ